MKIKFKQSQIAINEMLDSNFVEPMENTNFINHRIALYEIPVSQMMRQKEIIEKQSRCVYAYYENGKTATLLREKALQFSNYTDFKEIFRILENSRLN